MLIADSPSTYDKAYGKMVALIKETHQRETHQEKFLEIMAWLVGWKKTTCV